MDALKRLRGHICLFMLDHKTEQSGAHNHIALTTRLRFLFAALAVVGVSLQPAVQYFCCEI